MAAFFTPPETAIRICITASFEARVKRIANREGMTYEMANQETKIREETERKRFLDLYDIDINDLSKYDVIINNDRLTENQTYELCHSIALHALRNLD